MWNDCINENLIVINPKVKDKKDLFEKMVNHVYNQDIIRDHKAFLRALNQREETANTELISEVALPHARDESCEKAFLCIIVLKGGIDYGNPEMGPARIIFFFGAPPGESREYLQMLAKSSRLLRKDEFRHAILNAKQPSEILALIDRYDEKEKKTEISARYGLNVVLHNPDFLDGLLSALVELGITNASIIDSISMARKLAYEMPVFAGLSYMSPGRDERSMVVQCVVNEQNVARKLYELLREFKIDLDQPGTGYLYLTRLEELFGNPEEMVE